MPEIILFLAVLIMSAVIHEVSHGLVAYWLGDPTAKYMGRLTLNPISHLDPFGSILLPLLLLFVHSPILFASAKPVPYNPYNLRNQKYGPALVGAAGPASNLIIALVFGIFLRLFMIFGLVSINDLQNVIGGIFQGGGFLGTGSSVIAITFVLIIFVNVLLAFFNLIPIPPLDGSKLLFAVLPLREETKLNLERMGMAILFPAILVLAIIGILGWYIGGIENFFFKLVLGI